MVVAIGKKEYVRGSWIKPGAVVIDVGMHQIEDASKKSGFSYVGDVCFPEVIILQAQTRNAHKGVHLRCCFGHSYLRHQSHLNSCFKRTKLVLSFCGWS